MAAPTLGFQLRGSCLMALQISTTTPIIERHKTVNFLRLFLRLIMTVNNAVFVSINLAADAFANVSDFSGMSPLTSITNNCQSFRMET